MLYQWTCPDCGEESMIRADDDATREQLEPSVATDHNLFSPDCPQPVGDIRIIDQDLQEVE